MISATLLVADAGEIPIFRHFVVDGGWVTWFVLIPLSVIWLRIAPCMGLGPRREGSSEGWIFSFSLEKSERNFGPNILP